MFKDVESSLTVIKPKIANKPKFTKSCYFILPMLGYGVNYFSNIINCYLGDNYNKPELNFKYIFIHNRTFDEKILGLNGFNHYYRLEDKSYIFVFEIPSKFKEDYELFCQGKYSRMSSVCKDQLVKATGIKPAINSLIYKVLHRTTDQKEKIENLIGEKLKSDDEVYDSPYLDQEIYQGYLGIYNTKKMELEEEIGE